MRPIKLKLSGLNSFIEEQTIDFSRLTEMGMFGIFGPTGSGKSTILDAITLALYGKVPRSGGKPIGIINSQCNSVNVYYEFGIGDGQNRKIYSVQRILKRAANDGVNTEKAILCDITDPAAPQVIGEKAGEVNTGIEEIIGLTAEDFTRSVVLPQGSFSEFLKLSGAERRSMLERIFALEKYGQEMMEKIGRFKSKKSEEISRLEGVIGAYGAVSQDLLEQLTAEVDRLRDEKAALAERCRNVEEEYEKYQKIWNWQEELKGYRMQEADLAAQKDAFAAQRETVQKAEKAGTLKPVIDKVKQLEAELAEKNGQLEGLEGQLQEVAGRLAKLETEWKQAVQRKDKELPGLLEKRSDLERAIKINQEVKFLEAERQALAGEYRRLNNEISEKRHQLNVLDNEIDARRGQLKERADRIAAIKVSPQEREQVSLGYTWEKEYANLLQQGEELRAKAAVLETGLRTAQEQLKAAREAKLAAETKYRGLLEVKQRLAENCPGGSQELLNAQQQLNSLANELRELTELVRQKERSAEGLADRQHARDSLEARLETEKIILTEREKKVADLAAALEEANARNMAGILARELEEGMPCPVCGSACHPSLAAGYNLEEIQELEETLAHARQEAQAQKEQVLGLEIEVRAAAKEMEEKQAELADLLGRIGERNPLELQAKYAEKERNFARLKGEIEKWEQDTKENEAEIARIVGELGKLDSEEMQKLTECRKDQENLRSLQAEEEALLRKIAESRQKYEALAAALGLERIEPRYLEIQRNDQEEARLGKEEKEIKGQLENLEKRRAELLEQVNRLEIEIGKVEQSGLEKRNFIDKKKEESAKLSEGREPEPTLEALRQRIVGIEDACKSLEEALEQQKRAEADLRNRCAGLNGDKNALENLLNSQRRELDKMLESSGFDGIEEALRSFMTEEDIRKLKEASKEYENRVNIVQENIRMVSGRLQGESITEEQWDMLQATRRRLKEDLQEIAGQLLVKEEKQKEMQTKLEKLQELLARKKELDHRYGLLEELENLFRGKKFVEFVAKTQLNHIAREASKKLKEITRGRYALELNAEGEFIMRDDFNGGARRPTHTLSGGETFLTSLALALALSSHIQLGKASLEFFFLDEGFGTLDAEILDVVISSLERLQSEKLSVGLISHVEELKQRIPRKLIVKPAIPGMRGTAVEMEES